MSRAHTANAHPGARAKRGLGRREFAQVEAYVQASQALEPETALGSLRAAGANTLQEHGFPGRTEAWKFTRSAPLLQQPFQAPSTPAVVALPQGPWRDGARIVFVDGVLAPHLGAQVDGMAGIGDVAASARGRLGTAVGDVHGFLALNLAFLRHGVGWVGAPGADLGVLHIVHVSTGAQQLGAVRHWIEVGEGGSAEIYEHFVTVGEGASLTTAVTEVLVGQGAQVAHVRVLDEGPEALHVGGVGAVVAAEGQYRFSSVVLGSQLARVEIQTRLAGAGATADLSGLSLLRGHQHADHHVTVDHAEPHGTSDQVFRSVLDDESRSVYTGAVIVRSGAVKTSSNQLHHALLLSDDAIANTRPWLEIDNDDVSCAHGAAIGSLDADALFYLRQRGLSELEARSLLTAGFASERLAVLPAGPVQDSLQARAQAWLEAT